MHRNDIVALYKNGELQLKLSLLVIILGILGIMKRKYIFEIETPKHVICPAMRYFKPVEAVSFVYFIKEMVLFSIRNNWRT